MEDITREINIQNSPSSVSGKGTKTIAFQMDNCICKIIKENGEKGTGFFCIIKINKNKEIIPVLATNNHVLNSEDLKINKSISIIFNENKEVRRIIINKNRKVFTNKELDVSFIEIKPNDNIKYYLEIDEEIVNAEKSLQQAKYKKHSIYLMHYPDEEVEVSYGLIQNISENNINHLCRTENGSSGAPILSLKSFKVIGIHYGGINNKYNIGTLIKYPIDKFNQKYCKKSKLTISKQVVIKETIEEKFYDDNYKEIIKEKLYDDDSFSSINPIFRVFLLYEKYKCFGTYKCSLENVFGDIFIKNNKNNCKVIIDSYEYPLQNYYEYIIINSPRPVEFYIKNITLIETNIITDMSFMFCESEFDSIYFSEWDTSNVTNMSYMFSGCWGRGNLPDISKLDTSNVTNMSYMFSDLLKKYHNFLGEKIFSGNLPDISKWDTSNVINMCSMFSLNNNIKALPDISKWNIHKCNSISFIFYGCEKLEYLPDISNWNTSNISKLNGVFKGCKSLKYLPDISKWNTSRVVNMESLFEDCQSIQSFPDISKWEISNVNCINNLFKGCSSLRYLPDISNWKTYNITNMSCLFTACSLIQNLPDISKWNTSKVTNMRSLFSGCSSLLSLPNISKWNTSKITYMADLFCGCSSLISLPDISKWNTSKVTNMNSLFKECSSLQKIPDISKWNTSNLERIDYMFAGCSSLSFFPDMSKWNSLAINNSYHVFSTKKYGRIINVLFRTESGLFRNISIPSDFKFIELIKKLDPCKWLYVPKLENIIIQNGIDSHNINIPQNYYKNLEELEIDGTKELKIKLK